MTPEPISRSMLKPVLAAHLDALNSDLGSISEPHHSTGRQLAEWLVTHHRPGITRPVVVVCTGNSRSAMRQTQAAPSYPGHRYESPCRFRTPRQPMTRRGKASNTPQAATP